METQNHKIKYPGKCKFSWNQQKLVSTWINESTVCWA